MTKDIAERSTPFYCQVVEALSTYIPLSSRKEQADIRVYLKPNGDIVISYDGDQEQFEMPNWLYHNGCAGHTITPGRDCRGAPLN